MNQPSNFAIIGSLSLPTGVGTTKIAFTTEDYLQRIAALRERMIHAHLTHVLVYADREHFANMEYLIGHDPRFEQALLLIALEGDPTLFIGNEGIGYAVDITVPVHLVLYQNFSLQGQPRERLQPLPKLLSEAGLSSSAQLGIVGFKYFLDAHLPSAVHRYDLPAYIMEDIAQCVPAEQMQNFTTALTGLPDGLRLTLSSAREIAYYEYIASRCSEKVKRMIDALEPGLTEIQISERAGMDGLPQHVHPMINFGAAHVASGLRSPDDRALQVGEVAGLCLGPRGALVSRVGVASYDENSLQPQLQGSIESFYGRYWLMMTRWYASLHVGVTGDEIYQAVQQDIEALGIYLNPGHYIGADEWVNAPVYPGSSDVLRSGAYIQSDVIASSSMPVRTAIMEDGIVLADATLRQQLQEEYPDCWQRIVERQVFMREGLGINISDDVLPLSNLSGVYFPFMLDSSRIFSLCSS